MPKQLGADRQRNAPCWAVLLFCALWVVPCGASATSPCSRLDRGDLSGFSDSGGIVADLDGDKNPDLATATAGGKGAKGIQYRIELNLTSQAAATCLSVFATGGGLRISARDVDGDGDLDLVINNAWSLAPVGVWINDGHGTFTEGNPSSCLQAMRIEGPGILPDTRAEKFQAALCQSSRSCLDFSLPSHFWSDLTFDHVLLRSFSAPSLRAAEDDPSTRAPPAFIHQ